MQEMATIKTKVDIMHYLLETYKRNKLFDSATDDGGLIAHCNALVVAFAS